MKIDLFVQAVRESKKIIKIKRQQRYISRICRGGTPKDSELKLGIFVELTDAINHTNSYLFRMNSFRASGGSKMRIYLRKAYIWLLQHSLALPRWHVINGEKLRRFSPSCTGNL
jgi:hypothetical protein